MNAEIISENVKKIPENRRSELLMRLRIRISIERNKNETEKSLLVSVICGMLFHGDVESEEEALMGCRNYAAIMEAVRRYPTKYFLVLKRSLKRMRISDNLEEAKTFYLNITEECEKIYKERKDCLAPSLKFTGRVAIEEQLEARLQ
jgi:hypothetical protein